uniref:C2 domain-containing protein n=1 Tax=Ascaris suum TaxID=6253 RepID=F1LBS0_ASCSU
MLSIMKKISKSWKIVDDFEKHGMSTLIGYWTQGTPEAITIDAEMAGVDPIYGFPRVCDNTPVSAMFTMIPLDSNSEGATMNESNQKKEVVELNANCFKALIAFMKHTERCPWCPLPIISTHSKTTRLLMREQVSDESEEQDDLMIIGIGLLTVLAILSSTCIRMHSRPLHSAKNIVNTKSERPH